MFLLTAVAAPPPTLRGRDGRHGTEGVVVRDGVNEQHEDFFRKLEEAGAVKVERDDDGTNAAMVMAAGKGREVSLESLCGKDNDDERSR